MGLDHNATILAVPYGLPCNLLLILLRYNAAIVRDAIASVNLQTLLVRAQRHLDTGIWAPHLEDVKLRIVWLGVARTIKDESIVVASASGSAGIDSLKDISSDCLRRKLSEIERSAVGHIDAPSWDFDAVNVNNSIGIRHVEGVVQNGQSILVDVCSEVPVHVVGKHDWRGLIQRYRNHPRDPSRVIG